MSGTPLNSISENVVVQVPASLVVPEINNANAQAEGLPMFNRPSEVSFAGQNNMEAARVESSRGATPFSQRVRTASVGALHLLKEKTVEASSNPRDHWRAIVGEFLGTTTFIYLVLALNVNALAMRKTPSDTSLLEGAITAGGALTALIFTLGHVSGGHLNPAVTACIMIVRAIPVTVGVLYWVAQFLGSVAAAGLFLLTNPSGITFTAANVGLTPNITDGSAFLVQLVVSGFLCWVVLATGVDSLGGAEPRNFLAPLPIGIAVSVGVIMSGPLIGSSMNPAGAFGMILLNNFWNSAWIYIAGPLVAALIVGVVYKFVFMSRDPEMMSRIRARLHGNKNSSH